MIGAHMLLLLLLSPPHGVKRMQAAFDREGAALPGSVVPRKARPPYPRGRQERP